MQPKAFPKAPTLVLVITNDSAVFLKNGVASAYEMFGGRVQEVKRLVARLDLAKKKDSSKLCEVSFGMVTSRFGYVPANYTVMAYPNEEVMATPEDYERVQEQKDYLGVISYTSKLFDRIVVCVPAAMFALMLDHDTLPQGRVIAVTSPLFKDGCTERDWLFLERNGPRVGSANADAIVEQIYELSERVPIHRNGQDDQAS